MRIETRHFADRLRTQRSADGKMYVVGRAASYSPARSENLGWPGGLPIFEELAPGCFDDADTSGCICCINHDPAELLGKTSSGTLQVSTDARGLIYKALLPATQAARELVEFIKRGDSAHSSFAFALDPGDAEAETWEEIQVDGKPAGLRTIHKIAKLHDCSPLTGPEPAYSATSTGLSDRTTPRTAGELRGLISGANASAERRENSLCRQRAAGESEVCECDCEACVIDDDCKRCAEEACLDRSCRSAGCPNQEGARADEGEQCTCDCDSCISGDCTECSNAECDSEGCAARGCPMQDESNDRARLNEVEIELETVDD